MNFNEIKSPLQLLEFMDKNIKYGFVGTNGKKYIDDLDNWYEKYYLQSAQEILNSKIGTCWDQVELERYWFENNNYNFKTIFIWFEVNKKNDFPTHTFLLYEENNKWYWFEHAFEKFKGIHEFNTYEEAIKFVIEKHFEFSIQNNKSIKLKDKKLLKCYEYTKPKKHLKVDEYINFIIINGTNIN